VGVRKASPSRGASIYLHDELRVGDEIEIAPPRNHFTLVESAPHTVLIAGGIGVTPIWSMLQRLVALGASWELHYASRTRKDAAFLDELESLTARGATRSSLAFSREAGGARFDLDAIVAAAPHGSHFYASGPAQMLTAFEEATAHLPREKVHLERFGATDAVVKTGGSGFEINLARSDRTLEVPADKSILDVLLDEGVDVAFAVPSPTTAIPPASKDAASSCSAQGKASAAKPLTRWPRRGRASSASIATPSSQIRSPAKSEASPASPTSPCAPMSNGCSQRPPLDSARR
jgi:vanillate O-demethylase ferredoxin subunit